MRRQLYDRWPVCIANCADCGVGTHTLGEYYMVRDEVWEQAWAGRRKPRFCLAGLLRHPSRTPLNAMDRSR
jgi:hypothetical protein